MGSLRSGVTVVVPTYNRWPMVRSALWSALHQEGVDPAVVVVDDGSTDGTADRLGEVHDERLTVVRLPANRGVATARNRGLEEVRTEWVAFLDDDDVWSPSHLAGLLGGVSEARAAGRAVDIAYSGSVMVSGDRGVMRVRAAPDPERVPAGLRERNVLLVPSRVLARTEAVRAAGGFDPAFSLAADWDLWLRMVQNGGSVASPALSVAYTLHGQNMHLDMRRVLEEFGRLESRHAAALGERDHTFVDYCSRWIATGYRARGDRRRAARWYLRTFRLRHEPRDLGRAVGVLLGERAMQWHGGPAANGAVADEAARWLEPIRRIDRLPPEEVPFA